MKSKLKSGELIDSALKSAVGFGVALLGDIILKKIKRQMIAKNPDKALVGEITVEELKKVLFEEEEEA